MRAFWAYDWEVYHNFACVTFIHSTTPKVYIEAYVKLDIQYLNVRNEYHRLKKQSNPDTESIEILKTQYTKLVEGKRKLLSMMVCKQFIIYYDIKDKSKNICQLGELLMFFVNHKVLFGYNSVNYDSIITDWILIHGRKFDLITGKSKNNEHICECLKQVSDEIIANQKTDVFVVYAWRPYKYQRQFEDYDIQKILYLDKTFIGLKSVAINLRWHRIQELPIKHDEYIRDNQVWDMLDYNVNDTLITLKLILNQEEENDIREGISERYDLDVLNDSRSSIGKKLMTKFYSEESGLQYKDFKDLRTHRGKMKLSNIIDDRIVFKTKHCQDFLAMMKSEIVTPDTDYAKKFRINNTLYTIAKGGIHSIDDSRFYDSIKDGYIYRDADVTSYYPSILILFLIAPKHLSRVIFLKLVEFFKNDRVKAKKEKRKLEAEALKIVINRIYGALKDIMDYLFDPMATYKTTFNGQLSLLMLIEELEENGIQVVSANTDGIVSKFKPEQEELYTSICKRWELTTGFELEYTDYERYVRNNVNNYVAVKKGFRDKYTKLDKTSETYDAQLSELEASYVKGKGTFITDTVFSKGFIHPIVSIALRKYVLYDIDYLETIKTHWTKDKFNIYDYCMSQKVDKKFDVFYNYVFNGDICKDELQQYNRFYISYRGGGSITKEDVYTSKGKTKHRKQSLVSGQKLVLFNDFEEKSDYYLDYRFYARRVEDYLYYRKKNSRGSHKAEGLLVRGSNLFSDMELDYGDKTHYDIKDSVESKDEFVTELSTLGFDTVNNNDDIPF